MGDDRRQPEAIGDLLDGVLRRFGVARPLEVATLVARWEEMAPPAWAERSRPVGLTAGELLVEAVDGSAAALLRYQVTQLIAALDDAVGKGLVTSVKVRVARPGRPR